MTCWKRCTPSPRCRRPVPTYGVVLKVQRLLAGRSQRGRKVPDLLIAAAAEEAGLTVLHGDADFDGIASVTGQPSEWVVAAGTVP